MTEPEDRNVSDDAAMRARLAALSRDLSRNGAPDGQAAQPGTTPSGAGMGDAISLGMRATSEFVAAIVVGAVLGWQFDRWLNSSPIALIVFLGLGTAAGFWNVYRVATKSGGK